MSTTNKSIVFLVLTFAITWAIAIGGHYSGLKDQIGGVMTLALTMTGPAIAALICTFAFEKSGGRVKALGLGGRWTLWWFAAYLAPLLIAAGSVAITILLSDRSYADIGETVRAAAEAQGQGAEIAQAPAFLVSTGFILGMAVTFGALINWVILTFTEELGWRGYLHHLWRPFGFWRASLATGAIWGVWHAPAIYFYGLNYPTEPVIGIAIFVVFCMLLAPLHTFVRDRTNSVWAAGLFHGTFNAVGGLSLAALSEPTFPWNGVAGIGGFAAAGIAVLLIALLRPERQPASATETQPASA